MLEQLKKEVYEANMLLPKDVYKRQGVAMNPVYEKLLKCYESMKEEIPFRPKIALILGSGLGDYGCLLYTSVVDQKK